MWLFSSKEKHGCNYGGGSMSNGGTAALLRVVTDLDEIVRGKTQRGRKDGNNTSG
jgi:hypothetical protein